MSIFSDCFCLLCLSLLFLPSSPPAPPHTETCTLFSHSLEDVPFREVRPEHYREPFWRAQFLLTCLPGSQERPHGGKWSSSQGWWEPGEWGKWGKYLRATWKEGWVQRRSPFVHPWLAFKKPDTWVLSWHQNLRFTSQNKQRQKRNPKCPMPRCLDGDSHLFAHLTGAMSSHFNLSHHPRSTSPWSVFTGVWQQLHVRTDHEPALSQVLSL